MSAELARRKRIQWAEERQRRDAEDMRHVLGHAGGRRFVARVILDVCGLLGVATSSMLDEITMREGRRQVGATLYEEAQHLCPDLLVKLFQERSEERKADAARQATADELARSEYDTTGEA